MKNRFVSGAVFIGIYLVFVIATVPASWVLSKVQLPKGLVVENVTGSIWRSAITKISYQQRNQTPYSIVNVNISLSALSFLSLNPSIDVTFGDALIKGPEGSLTASGFTTSLSLENVNILLSANDVAQRLSLPMPVEAHNDISINIPSFVVGKPLCESLEGNLIWQKASVSALDEKVMLGALKANLGCESGALALTIDPNNDLGLSFTTYVRGNTNASGDGFLTPAEKFPEQLKGLLPFLGNKDNQGRYRLSF